MVMPVFPRMLSIPSSLPSVLLAIATISFASARIDAYNCWIEKTRGSVINQCYHLNHQRFGISAFSHPPPRSKSVTAAYGIAASASPSVGETQAKDDERIKRIKETESNSATTSPLLYLLSLPPKNDTFQLPAESLIRECWKWKDSTLGDGRDYFVPRPTALREFHSLFVGLECSVEFYLEQCDKINTYGGYDDGDGAIYHHYPVKVELRMPKALAENGRPKEVIMFQTGVPPKLDASSQKATVVEDFVVEECAALSNCARLDVILSLRPIQNRNDISNNIEKHSATKEIAAEVARYAVAYHLQRQISSRRSKTTSLLERTGLASWLDLPGAVNMDASNQQSFANDVRDVVDEVIPLAQRLTVLEGPLPISTHLSHIAAGLAPRPNRPEREVIFRPYSSRDAHILLQLKRTVEVVSVLDSVNENNENGGRGPTKGVKREGKNGNGRGRIKTLLDGALTAGKAARNEDIVPEIRQLKEFGSDGTPPSNLARVVAEAAIQRAVNPSVSNCVERLAAMEQSERIYSLRRRVNDLVSSLSDMAEKLSPRSQSLNSDEARKKDLIESNWGCEQDFRPALQKLANQLLHAPTMELREGNLSDEEINEAMNKIEKELYDRLDYILASQ